jgi:hypothetical protein
MKALLAAVIPIFTASAFAEAPPTEFVTQVLEPTGGKIPRPKDWFYAEGHHGAAYVWTLSREDTTGGKPYTTGVRIQTLTGIKEGTGKTAKQFILDFLDAKKKEAAKVIKACKEQDQGLFTRICLETEEGPYHILYSLFWGANGMDLAVVSIAGTTKELWETYAPTFDKMNAFELIDMKRFGSTLSGYAQDQTYQNPADKKAYTAPGGWKTYSPEEPVQPSAEKVALDHVRLLQNQEEIAARTTVEELTSFTKLAEAAASEVFFQYEKPASLLVQFTCTPGKHVVEIASEGEPPQDLLQAYYDKLIKMKPLRVSGEVKFQLMLKVKP